MSKDLVVPRYLDDSYFDKNPSWDMEDSPWKARHIHRLLANQGLTLNSVAEIGCGAGGVLPALRQTLPNAELFGFDIAPAAAAFWPPHEAAHIAFHGGNCFDISGRDYHVILPLDVLDDLAVFARA